MDYGGALNNRNAWAKEFSQESGGLGQVSIHNPSIWGGKMRRETYAPSVTIILKPFLQTTFRVDGTWSDKTTLNKVLLSNAHLLAGSGGGRH
jgi:hypothetical protein